MKGRTDREEDDLSREKENLVTSGGILTKKKTVSIQAHEMFSR